MRLNYHELVKYVKELRRYFKKKHSTLFTFGKVNQNNSEFSYFSLTSKELKRDKLKFVIILNHELLTFEICLSGQNKNVRKTYWNFFNNIEWNKYHLAESINESLSIVDHTLLNNPDFKNKEKLNARIEIESLKFINKIREILE